MKVLEFKFISIEDNTDKKFEQAGAWSRIYEYPAVLECIDKYCKSKEPKIHNTSWGFEGVHVTFKTELERRYGVANVKNSDIKHSGYANTSIYNITQKPPEEEVSKYDVVLNISTVEEVENFSHVEIFNNLYNQVKDDGILVITFDYPGLDLGSVEDHLGLKIKDNKEKLNGSNSVVENNIYSHLNCGLICAQKTKNTEGN